MLFRFCLYGFLKNQRYFEAFLILAFLEKGLDFFQIGLLVAFRELTVNLFEIPSGSIADVLGRRRSMIVAFGAYIVSFLAFGFATALPLLLLGMFLYGIGEAFRSGTHKAMIFTWLRLHGREAERVRVYGYTRSWSKFGSAVSVIAAAVIVLVSDGYSSIFFMTAIPYAIGVVNFLGYPKELDAKATERAAFAPVARHMLASIRSAISRPGLRRLFLESMGFDGVFTATKDYLQPVLEMLALTLAASLLSGPDWSDAQSTALLVGPVYFLLYVLAGVASRASHRLADRCGGERRAAHVLWIAVALVYAGILAAAGLGAPGMLVATFVLLHIAHNLWRPILISRFDTEGSESQGASLLSIEGQARRVSTMIVAPLLGFAVDTTVASKASTAYWPVGAVGLVVALVFVAAGAARRRKNNGKQPRLT